MKINRDHLQGEPGKGSPGIGSTPQASHEECDWADIWEKVKQTFLSTTTTEPSPAAPESQFAKWYRDSSGITYDGLSFTVAAQERFDPAWLSNEICFVLGQAFNAHGLEIPSFCVVDPFGQALTRTPQQIQQEKTMTTTPPPPPPPPPPAKLCDCGQEIPPDKADKRNECQQCWERKHEPKEQRQPNKPIWTPDPRTRQVPNQTRKDPSPFEQARSAHIDYLQASLRNRGAPAEPP